MEKKLKLNYKNTFFIGLAFFSILMLWQIYNTYCPLILNELLEKYQAKYILTAHRKGVTKDFTKDSPK